MNARAKRFLFAEDFGEGAGARRIDADAFKAATEDAYARGLAEGRRLASAETPARLASALEEVAASSAQALSSLAQERELAQREAARLAQIFARKLAGRLLERAPLELLADAAADCLRHLAGQPHVVARVPEDLVDQAKALLDKIALERGLQGKLVILGEPGLQAGDFSIEWSEGGVQRDGAALERAVLAAIARHIEAGS